MKKAFSKLIPISIQYLYSYFKGSFSNVCSISYLKACLYLNKIPKNNFTILLGHEFYFLDVNVFLEIYSTYFESSIFHIACKSRSSNSIIIDGGANIGVSTIYFASNYPDCLILAFEPDPKNFEILKKNVKKYANIKPFNVALGGREGFFNFYQADSLGGSLTFNELNSLNKVLVRVDKLSKYLSPHDEIFFLKLDIEGEEVEVVTEIENYLSKINYVFIEYHSFIDIPQNFSTLLSSLENNGLRYHIKHELPAKFPFLHLPIINSKDLRLNVFCWRSEI